MSRGRSSGLMARTGAMAAIAVFCTLLWGTAFPMIKIGYELFEIAPDDVPTKLIFAGLRFFLAGLLVMVIGYFTSGRKLMTIGKRDIVPVAILGLFQTFLQYLLLYIGLTYITGTKSALLTSVSTFASVLLSAVFFRSDRITARKIIGCCLGVLGIIVMNLDAGGLAGFTLIGDGLVILSNICGAAGNVISKGISKGRRPEQLAAWQLILGGSSLIIVGIILGGSLPLGNPGGILVLLYLAAMAGIAFMLWTMLLFRHPVSRVAVFNLLIPVFGTMWSGLFLGESIFTLTNISSLALVCIGIFAVNSEKKNKQKK